MINFKSYNLKEKTLEYIEKIGFNNPTDIQQKVIPLVLKGKDVVGISKTGSGKTHAFLIPLFDKINLEKTEVQIIITAPTRELAVQLFQRAKEINQVMPDLKIVEAIGGADRNRLVEQIKMNPHVVIGTPGRINDLVFKQKVLRVDKVKTLVVDEADMTLEFGFLEDVDQVAGIMPNNLQMLVFGATIPQSLKPFLKKYMSNPVTVEIESELSNPKIEYVFVPCKHRSYQEQLLQILPGFQPYVCLIFANTRKEAHQCAELLKEQGYGVVELHGDLQARERKQALREMASTRHKYIVATDIAARGIDIEAVSHVVSLGFPSELDFFIHRAGRTARAGKTGICYALFNKSDENNIANLKRRGIPFKQKVYRNNQWRVIKVRAPRRNDEMEREIAKIVKGKGKKVKPGYKKKIQKEVSNIKRKRRRQQIQDSIKEIKKEKYKQKQKENKIV
ncbi:MAG: DEAD/DEAH box helicase [Erysipelotrichaceae bacterium]